jgi:hypothetical protein
MLAGSADDTVRKFASQKDFNRQVRREMRRRTQGEAAMIFFAFFAMFLRDLCGEDLRLSKTPPATAMLETERAERL